MLRLVFTKFKIQISYLISSKLLPFPHILANPLESLQKWRLVDDIRSNEKCRAGQKFCTKSNHDGVGNTSAWASWGPASILRTFNIIKTQWQMYLIEKSRRRHPARNISMKSLLTMRSTSSDFASLKIHYSLDKLNRRLATSL